MFFERCKIIFIGDSVIPTSFWVEELSASLEWHPLQSLNAPVLS